MKSKLLLLFLLSSSVLFSQKVDYKKVGEYAKKNMIIKDDKDFDEIIKLSEDFYREVQPEVDNSVLPPGYMENNVFDKLIGINEKDLQRRNGRFKLVTLLNVPGNYKVEYFYDYTSGRVFKRAAFYIKYREKDGATYMVYTINDEIKWIKSFYKNISIEQEFRGSTRGPLIKRIHKKSGNQILVYEIINDKPRWLAETHYLDNNNQVIKSEIRDKTYDYQRNSDGLMIRRSTTENGQPLIRNFIWDKGWLRETRNEKNEVLVKYYYSN